MEDNFQCVLCIHTMGVLIANEYQCTKRTDSIETMIKTITRFLIG